MADDKRALLEQALKSKRGATDRAGPKPSPREPEALFPVSTAQERLLYLEQLEPGGPDWWVAVLMRLEGALDRPALERAHAHVFQRHEPLRTVFVERDGRFFQRLVPKPPRLDVEAVSPEHLSARVEASVRQGGDVRVGPLARATLFELSPTRNALLLSLHGSLQDAWSLRLIVLELADTYARIRRGEALPPANPLQYIDYAVWERERADARVSAGLDHFRRVLAAPPPPPDLAVTRPTAGQATFEGRMVQPAPWPSTLVTRLKTFCRTEKTTPFVVVHAALSVLVGRLCRQDDVLIGTSVDTRTFSELREVVGCFENTLLLRSNLGRGLTFSEVLARSRATCLEAITHREVGIDRVVAAMRGERDPGRGFPTSIIYNFEEEIPDQIPFADLVAHLDPVMVGRSKFDLAFRLYEIKATGEIAARIHIRTDLFTAADGSRLWRRLGTLLEHALTSPKESISRLGLIDPQEREELGQLSAAPPPGSRAARTIPSQFRAQVSANAERLALVTSEHELSYGDLADRVDALSSALVRRGLKPGTRVGVFLERGVDWVVATLAVWQAGGTYVPLVPDYPAPRVLHVLSDSGAELVITRGSLWDRLPEPFDERAVRLEQVNWTVGFEPAPVSPDQVAYLIYTSGSTGAPKGVEVTHRSLSNTIGSALAQFEKLQGTRALQFISPAFDASINDLCWALAGGRTLYLAPPKSPGGRELEEFAAHHQVEHLNLPASVLATLDPRALPTVRVVSSGGEACTPALVDRWRSQAHFFNRYGPTEIAIECAVASCEAQAGQTPIGHPVAGASLVVVDERLQQVPIGGIGELLVGGLGVAQGYRHQPGLTAERFVPDPFSPLPGARAYRTGDLVRQSADGTFYFLGRVDEQIKLRGLRIEPGEIEDAVRRIEGVADSAVAAKTWGTGQAQLVAYVTWRTGTEPLSPDTVRARLKATLPSHLVPNVVMTLPAMPRTHSGKVDRAALPEPKATSEQTADVTEFHDEPQRVVAEAVAALTGGGAVGLDANFFELGGDSLLSLQLVAKVAQRGYGLSVADVLKFQTIRAIAAVTRKRTAAVGGATAPATAPLTPIQRWFLSEHPLADAPGYSQSLLLESTTALDLARLADALREVVARHRALATRLHQVGTAQAHQELGASLAPPTATHCDVSAATGPEAQQQLLATRTAHLHVFDLQSGPLVRAVVVTRKPNESPWLLLIIHHLVIDVVSWRVVVEDLDRAYRRASGEQLAAVEGTSDVATWANGLAQLASAPTLVQEVGYWKSRPWNQAVRIPTDASGLMDRLSMRHCSGSLSSEQTRELLRFGGGRPHEVLMTALAFACTQWARGTVLQLDVERHGREDVIPGLDLSRTVGWFTAYSPVLLDVGAKTWPERLVDVQRAYREIPTNGLGFIVLKYLGSPEVSKEMALIPPSSVCFNYMGVVDHALAESTLFTMAPGIEGPVDAARTRSDLLLEVNAGVTNGCLRTVVSYSTARHQPATIEALLKAFHAAVESLLASRG